MTTCTVCREPLHGHPDDDVTCAWCERNFDGDPLRYPPRQQRTPVPWWVRERLELAPHTADRRALVYEGTWYWSPEHGGAEPA